MNFFNKSLILFTSSDDLISLSNLTNSFKSSINDNILTFISPSKIMNHMIDNKHYLFL